MRTTEEECVRALCEAAKRLGGLPTKAEYEELGLRPASATIIRVMGGWNDAKEAAGLETNPSRGSRVGPKPDDVELPDGTSWQELSVDQRWHYRNVEWNAERTLRRRAELRAWLYEYKRTSGGCIRCDEDDPACLDFHHVDEDEKEMAVNEMVVHGYGKKRIEEEIVKCEVLCANCHRKEHYELSLWPDGTVLPDDSEREVPSVGSSCRAETTKPTHPRRAELRAWVYEYKQDSGGCVRCDEDDPACLDFHHVDEDEKTISISSLIANEPSKDRLLGEIASCEILCANCHRKEHYQVPSGSMGSQD